MELVGIDVRQGIRGFNLIGAYRHIHDTVQTIQLVTDDRKVGQLRDLGIEDVVLKFLHAEIESILLL